jgi:hypothetical protein
MLDAPIIGDHVDLLPLEMYLPLLNGKANCVSSEIFYSSSFFLGYSLLLPRSWLRSMSGGLGVSGAESMIPPWRFIK